jgi:hypothetical protein
MEFVRMGYASMRPMDRPVAQQAAAATMFHPEKIQNSVVIALANREQIFIWPDAIPILIGLTLPPDVRNSHSQHRNHQCTIASIVAFAAKITHHEPNQTNGPRGSNSGSMPGFCDESGVTSIDFASLFRTKPHNQQLRRSALTIPRPPQLW